MIIEKMKKEWLDMVSPVVEPDKIESVEELKAGGSPRRFYRLQADSRSFVIQEVDDKKDLDEYIEIGRFLKKHSVSAPAVLSEKEGSNAALFTDAGDRNLQDLVLPLLREGKDQVVVNIYKNVINELLKLQVIMPDKAPELIRNRKFDHDYYIWESDYFREKCAGNFFKFTSISDPILTVELEELARGLADEPEFIVHRDFQSQNIHINEKGFFILDFQSARLGSIFYDVASLLKDPYVELPLEIQDRLFRYYNDMQLRKRLRRELTLKSAKRIYNRVALQRLMQALGAYGKLGMDDRQVRFLKYIPPALRLMNETLNDTPEFTRLKRLVERMLEEA